MEPLTIEQLQQENEKLKAEAEDLKAELEVTKQVNEDLKAELEVTKQVNEDLKAELEVTKQVNEELTAKIEQMTSAKSSDLGAAGQKAQAAAKPVLPTDTFEVDGKKKKFIAPVFVYGGKRILASQALNDTELLNELVEKGIGVIVDA